MKTLVLADRRPDILLEETLQTKFDLILLAGDLMPNDLRELAADNPNSSTLKIGVYGNHCLEGYFDILGIVNAAERFYQLPNGMTLFGIEGCPRYKEKGDFLYTDAEIEAKLASAPQADIILSHSPPYGINDDPGDLAHEGWKSLRQYVDEKPPKYFIHGHTYPKEPLGMHGETEFIYVSGHRIIYL